MTFGLIEQKKDQNNSISIYKKKTYVVFKSFRNVMFHNISTPYNRVPIL